MTNIVLPGSQGPKNYIEGNQVTFKSKAWLYSSYDAEAKEKVESKTIKWIIVGSWMQFITTKVATKAKGLQFVSQEFWWDIQKNWVISMRKNTRDKSWSVWEAAGKKTFADWKEEGMKTCKVVYLMDADDNSKLSKVIFSGKAFVDMNKLITPDIPNYIVELGVSTDAEETDNGEFFSPTLVKVKAIDAAIEAEVLTQIKFVDSILNKKEIPGLSVNEAEEVFPSVEWFDDIPY